MKMRNKVNLNKDLNMGPHYMNELVNHINKLNEQTKVRGAVGFLTNDPDHWAGYNVYTVEQLLNYLEREFQHNVKKDERRNQ